MLVAYPDERHPERTVSRAEFVQACADRFGLDAETVVGTLVDAIAQHLHAVIREALEQRAAEAVAGPAGRVVSDAAVASQALGALLSPPNDNGQGLTTTTPLPPTVTEAAGRIIGCIPDDDGRLRCRVPPGHPGHHHHIMYVSFFWCLCGGSRLAYLVQHLFTAMVRTTMRELPFWGQTRVRRATMLFDRAYQPLFLPPHPHPTAAAGLRRGRDDDDGGRGTGKRARKKSVTFGALPPPGVGGVGLRRDPAAPTPLLAMMAWR